jgi:hypothetical protein
MLIPYPLYFQFAGSQLDRRLDTIGGYSILQAALGNLKASHAELFGNSLEIAAL